MTKNYSEWWILCDNCHFRSRRNYCKQGIKQNKIKNCKHFVEYDMFFYKKIDKKEQKIAENLTRLKGWWKEIYRDIQDICKQYKQQKNIKK